MTVATLSRNHASAQALLTQCKIAVRATGNTVTIQIDDSCAMAQVLVNDVLIMVGNFWDFHPGCHGIDVRFSSYDELADVFVQALEVHGVTLIRDTEWTYED